MSNSPTATLAPATDLEILPGYRLRERLGSGGFGEVWSVQAPGDLIKAAKIIYGRIEDNRAARELEALERVRGVNHPFLLSIERVEVVTGSLVIILELAEGSLKEEFDAYREQGYPGIPRDELLAYLRDSADALDYLYESQSLQHLDVKPENLMLVGRHVKVGDFGLLKDVSDSRATLMGGVSPAYAAPEVFDGRPSQFSDQYSLAVVYQELLTGTMPFSGRTTAQLAMQHSHQPPNLDPLPVEQRSTIRRALAKKPEHRFPTCKAFVEDLIKRKESSEKPAATQSPAPRNSIQDFFSKNPRMASMMTQNHVVSTTDDVDDGDEDRKTKPIAATTVSALPPLKMESCTTLRPTLFVGLGGAGTQALAAFKHNLATALEARGPVPSIQFAALDTDAGNLHKLMQLESGFDPDECLALPLRTANEYREAGRQRFASVSRRWFYNIPRSQQTEHLRPLGRLALLDHLPRVQSLLSAKLEALQDPATSNESIKHNGWKFASAEPQVFVVASISGGAGSGQIIDLGYLLRSLLHGQSRSDERLTSILLHSTSRKEQTRNLEIGNALAFLSEWDQCNSSPNPFPGDRAAGIPAMDKPCGPFEHCYLLPLGQELDDARFQQGLQEVADYLTLNTLPPSREYFEQVRRDRPSHETKMRSFGVAKSSLSCYISASLKARFLCFEVASRWQIRDESPALADETRDELQGWTNRSLGLLRKPPEELCMQLRKVAFHGMNTLPEDFTRRTVMESIGKLLGAPTINNSRVIFEHLLQQIDERICKPPADGSAPPYKAFAAAACEPLIKKTVQSMEDWIDTLLDTANIRIRGAHFALRHAQTLLESQREQAESAKRALDTHLKSSSEIALTELLRMATPENEQTERNPIGEMLRHLTDYMQTRIRQANFEVAQHLYVQTLARLEPIAERLQQLDHAVDRLAQQFRVREIPQPLLNAASGVEPQELTEQKEIDLLFGGRVDDAVEKLEAKLGRNEKFGLSKLLGQDGQEQVGHLAQQMTHLAGALVERDLLQDERQHDQELAGLNVTMGGAIEQSTPELVAGGGRKRLLMLTPGDASDRHILENAEKTFGAQPSVFQQHALNVTFCCEADEIEITNVARFLCQDNDEGIAIADKLRARES